MMQVSSWKQQYLENHARDLLEAFDQQTVSAQSGAVAGELN